MINVHRLIAIFSTAILSAAIVQAGEFPWSDKAPADVVRNALTPDFVFDETPGNWRPDMQKIFIPLVRDCKTAREAVLKIAANMTKETGVIYSPERRHPCMSALEALAEKKVSCTGQSILLICALRSVDIPARAVGLLTWNHIRGNHTWVEAWFDGEWHMIEFNEKDFNTPWVMEYLGMINPQNPAQRIYATNADPTGLFFPTVWNLDSKIPAVDVTDRYVELAREYNERHGLSAAYQRLLIDLQPRPETPLIMELVNEHGECIGSTKLPVKSDDIRKFAPLDLPRHGSFTLRIRGTKATLPVKANANAMQIIRLQAAPAQAGARE